MQSKELMSIDESETVQRKVHFVPHLTKYLLSVGARTENCDI